MKPAAGKALSLILTIAMIVPMVCALQSCKFVDEIKDKMIDTPEDYISKQEIARLIISAISQQSNVADSYSQIPDAQLNGISYSVFNEYVSILRDISSEYGTVTSFRFLNEDDSTEYINSLLAKSEMTVVPEKYGKLDVVELEYSGADKRENNLDGCRFFVSEDSSGVAYLSKELVTDTIAAHNYLMHYFTMLENNNTDGLYALLEPLYNSDIYINTVIAAKAQYITEYYMLKVRSVMNEYVYDVVTPFVVHVFIPKVIGEDGESLTTHEVTLSVGSDGNYMIYDDIPWYLDSASIGIYDSKQNPVRVQGVTLNDAKLRAILGDPISMNRVVLSDEDKAFYGKSLKIRAFYNGIVFDIFADEDSDGNWIGEVGDMIIYSNNYSIDGHISSGMNKTELLLIYPMIDEANFSFKFMSGKTEYIVDFTFNENNNIEYVNIIRSDLYRKTS